MPDAGDHLARIMRNYDERASRLRDLGPIVEGLIQALLTEKGMRVHSTSHRVKAKPSLERKVSQKTGRYDSLADVHDFLGIRVITYFPDEVDEAARVIENEFKIDVENSLDQRALLDPDRFGYLSLHYVASLNDDRGHLTEHRRFESDVFEVQLRSILQHSWAEIEHDLGYKSSQGIPRAIRRRFSRLAGLLEMADDEFQAVRDAVADYETGVRDEISSNPETVDINRESIVALAADNAVVARLDALFCELTGAELLEIDPVYADLLARELQDAGCATIGEVEDALTELEDTIDDFMRKWLTDEVEGAPPGVSLFHLAYVLLARDKSLAEIEGYLRSHNIGGPDEQHSVLARKVAQTFKEVSG